ncbi:hypothetical protein ACI3KX_05845 [Microbacterium sp. ZW CA_36]|uniref:hypothetical protein n=1 Tax=Microbacterium sp. ZW CA_36 TaxID=3378078 RepID=UPI00385354B3
MDAPRGPAGREADELQRKRQRATDVAADDVARELNDLRARAYGPEPDIEADPAAMSRLIELEAANIAAVTPVSVTASADHHTSGATPMFAPASGDAAEGSRPPGAEPMIPTTSGEGAGRPARHRATLLRSRAWFVVGAVVIVASLIYAAIWLLTPHPDATLHPTAVEPDNSVIQELTADVGNPDISTLRHFERYREIAVWSVDNGSGDICLLAWDRGGGSGRFEFQCLPPAVELALHMPVVAEAGDSFGEWLADGSVISLHLRENTVDVVVHPPPVD